MVAVEDACLAMHEITQERSELNVQCSGSGHEHSQIAACWACMVIMLGLHNDRKLSRVDDP